MTKALWWSALLVVLGLSLAPRAEAGKVGEVAPALEPKAWLNVEKPLAWSALQGKLILIEKWATW